MSAPAAELQKAIFAALAADDGLRDILGPGRIHDLAPAGVQFPYITFGRTSIYDWSTDTESGTEQLLTIHVWSKAQGKKETHAIIDRVAACLHDVALAMDGHHLVSLRMEFSEIVYDDDLSVHHGLLRFRAVTEPAA